MRKDGTDPSNPEQAKTAQQNFFCRIWGRFTCWADRRVKPKVREAAWYLIGIVALASLALWWMHGLMIALTLAVAALGLLLVAFSELTDSKWLRRTLTLTGVILVAWWYLKTLPGLFFPFANVYLETDPAEHPDAAYTVMVSSDKRRGRPDCTIDHDSSTLTCQVRVVVDKPVNQTAR